MAIRKQEIIYKKRVNYVFTRIWSNLCGECKEISDEWGVSASEKADGYEEGVWASDADKIIEKLKRLIAEKNASGVQQLLQTNFIYPTTRLLVLLGHENYRFARSENHYYRHNDDYQSSITGATFTVRPNVEALFTDHKKQFTALVDLILEADDKSLYEAFLLSLANTDLQNQTIFRWDEGRRNRALGQLAELAAYGQSLLKNAKKDSLEEIKGSAAKSLAQNLTSKIIDKDTTIPAEDDDKARLTNLKFRLEIYRDLHAHDIDFATFRGLGWKRIFANLCSILLTGGIANGMHYLMTGNGLFYNQTTTQEKVARVEAAIDTDPIEVLERVERSMFALSSK